MQHPPHLKIIKKTRKSPVLKASAFGCLKDTPSINLTRGCLHSCVYCYARGFTGAPPPGEVHLYQNLPEVLERELARKRKIPSWVSFSTASDAFQAIDEVHEISYRTMKMLLERGIGISFLTKGLIPFEFIDLFKRYPHLVRARIGMVSLDDGYRELLEPFSAPPLVRLSLVRHLIHEGIETSVRVDPLIPNISDTEEAMEKLIRGLRAAQVRDVSVSYLVMRPSIMKQFRSELPSKLAKGILEHYDGQPWQRVITSARTRLAPKAMRMVRYRRFKQIAAQHGLECSLCGCKNPDLPWESCHPWIGQIDLPRSQPGRQLNLFAGNRLSKTG
jgi:DNA repair photolyase